MDRGNLAQSLYQSATSVYEYVSAMQFVTDPPMGVSIAGVSDYTVRDGYAVLHLDSTLADTGGLMLLVGTDLIDSERAELTRYDEMTKTIVLRSDEGLLSKLSDQHPSLRVVSDMRFLIKSVMDFIQTHGDRIRLPETDPIGVEPTFPPDRTPSPEQVSAVRTVLNRRMSYIWGAPGTGKTQMVLSTCLRAYIAAGKRVAVFAPTNNSLEQVLRGVFASFSGDELRDVLALTVRLGMPTKQFLKEFPEVCEDRQAQRRLEKARAEKAYLREVLFERTVDSLSHDLEQAEKLASSFPSDALPEVIPGLDSAAEHLLSFCMGDSNLAHCAAGWGINPASESLAAMREAMLGRQRPVKDIYEYDDLEDAEIMSSIVELDREIRSLRLHDSKDRLTRARIIAGTPQQFISRFRPKGSEDDGDPELDVDHIFLDEAGYCGLMIALPLFTNGVPVTFLGDHMQLPPVCELDPEVLRSGIEGANSMRLAFLWDMSALHAEQAIGYGAESLAETYLRGSRPVLRSMVRSDLTISHRFGGNLAEILDRYVYNNGLTGASSIGDLRITFIDAVCGERRERENTAERDAIVEFLKENGIPDHKVAVLTPYSGQVRLLRSSIRRYRDSIMTVHGSQGREWDTVVLSVADNGVISRDVPFRFTSSQTDIGLRVINTAVSRAKRNLVVVCDRGFWMGRDDELIGAILEEATPEPVSGRLGP